MARSDTGRCVCGAVAYRLTDKPVMVYACHCTDCQKRSGSAFGLSMWVRRNAIEVTKGEPAAQVYAPEDGRPRRSRICAQCTTRLWSEPAKYPDFAIVRAGTLDDTSGISPVAHLWTRSAQPWFTFPESVPRYETQPADLLELTRIHRR